MDKHVVLVSRIWKSPDIHIDVTDEGIGLSITLEAFLDALGKEMGNPTFLLTQQMLLDKMKAAAVSVTQAMKAESARVM